MHQKIFSLILTITIFQTSSLVAQTHLAVKAGPTFDKPYNRYYGIKQPADFGVGGNIGLQLSSDFEAPLYFMGVALLSNKSIVIKPDTGTTTSIKYRLTYLSLAPMLSFHTKGSGGNFLAISAGPMGSFGLAGNQKNTTSNVETSRKVKFSTSSDLSIIDLSFYSSLGYHMPKWFAELGYEHGFVNINHETDKDGYDIQNRTFSLNIGFYLR